MSQRHLVIIGAGIAGLSAAQAARKADTPLRITILSDDSHPPYYRQRLCEVLEDPDKATALSLHPDTWYAEQRIDLRLNTQVRSVQPGSKTITLADGSQLAYSALILAVGSQSFVPPIKGAHLPGVHTLWTMDDAQRIAERIPKASRSIVIGGGVLGLEAAYNLHKRGLDSLILERLPRLMMRQLDERAAELFTAQVHKEGSQVATSALVAVIYADADGNAAGVRLEDGSRFEAGLILISAGVRPRLDFLSGSGIAIDRYITVDAGMRTNLPDIYAAGDCAILDGRWYGLWPISRAQGTAAGENAAGGDVAYEMPVPPYLVKTMGTQIASAGLVEGSSLPPEVLERMHQDIMETSQLFQYAKKVYVGDQLSGFILLGDTKAFSSLNKQMHA